MSKFIDYEAQMEIKNLFFDVLFDGEVTEIYEKDVVKVAEYPIDFLYYCKFFFSFLKKYPKLEY